LPDFAGIEARDTNAAQSRAIWCRLLSIEQPKEKPSFSRIYRPADLYLNGECTDANGYHIERNSLASP
jgi:hypothetical protein